MIPSHDPARQTPLRRDIRGLDDPKAVDRDGHRLVRTPFLHTWRRVTPERQRLIDRAMKWIGWTGTAVSAVLVPVFGWVPLAITVGASMGAALLVHTMLTYDLETVPRHHVYWVNGGPRFSRLTKDPIGYVLVLAYLTALAVFSVYLVFDGEPLFGAAGAIVLGWASLGLVRERRARTERVASRLRPTDD